MVEEWKKKFPLIIGVEGKDEYWLRYNDGETVSWEERDRIAADPDAEYQRYLDRQNSKNICSKVSA